MKLPAGTSSLFRRLLLLVLLVLQTTGLSAADFYSAREGPEVDHLEPISPSQEEYDRRIDLHLRPDGEFARMIVRPSFQPEYYFGIEEKSAPHQADGKKRYFISTSEAAESLYYTMAENNDERRTKKVSIRYTEREISRDLAVATQRVWAKMLLNTRYPATYQLVLDGVNYRFGVWVRGLGSIYGETWSPSKPMTSGLASLGQDIFEFGSKKSKLTEADLIAKLRRFETSIPPPR